MAYYIGIDFGNVNTFPSFIMDMNLQTRRGGTPLSLLPAETGYNAGIPTTYHVAMRAGRLVETFGLPASTASPAKNRRNLLKRRFQKSETIDGHLVKYDEVITKMIEHIVRIANRTMQQNYRQTSNEIALAYPVEFTHAQMQHLINLAEKATLEDGRHVKVAGTIREPAAAALAYLGSIKTTKQDYSVLVYDLGGGTFDVASVSAHLQGNVRNGSVEYYDVHGFDGAQLGGAEFDEAMLRLFITKSRYTPTGNRYELWRREAENCKISLSDPHTNAVYPELINADDEPLDVSITRAEYENAIRSLVQKTVDLTVNLLKQPNIPQPDLILLTGGQSQTPLIQRMLAEALPAYKDKIIIYMPQQAISFGAARFGALEADRPRPEPPITPEPARGSRPAPRVTPTPPDPVRRRNRYDLGIRNILDANGVVHVDTIIKAGTLLPTGTSSDWQSYSLSTARSSDTSVVVEANKNNPNPYNQDGDYTPTMDVVFDFGRQMPKGKNIEFCLYIDERDTVHALVRDPDNPSVVKEAEVALRNFA